MPLQEGPINSWMGSTGTLTGGSIRTAYRNGEEQVEVVRSLVDRLGAIAAALQEHLEVEDECEEVEEGERTGEERDVNREDQEDETFA